MYKHKHFLYLLQQAGLRELIQCSLIHFLIIPCAGNKPEIWRENQLIKVLRQHAV